MIDPELFRKTMRQWAAGVTVVTIDTGEKVHGMTANSFTSVSCNPPLLLFCVGHTNDTYGLLKEGITIGVNLLSESQQDLSYRFATKTDARYNLDDLDTRKGPYGATLFDGCAAVIEASIAQSHRAGDHTIFIAEMLWANPDPEKTPLVYSRGSYARLTPFPEEREPGFRLFAQ